MDGQVGIGNAPGHEVDTGIGNAQQLGFIFPGCAANRDDHQVCTLTSRHDILVRPFQHFEREAHRLDQPGPGIARTLVDRAGDFIYVYIRANRDVGYAVGFNQVLHHRVGQNVDLMADTNQAQRQRNKRLYIATRANGRDLNVHPFLLTIERAFVD